MVSIVSKAPKCFLQPLRVFAVASVVSHAVVAVSTAASARRVLFRISSADLVQTKVVGSAL